MVGDTEFISQYARLFIPEWFLQPWELIKFSYDEPIPDHVREILSCEVKPKYLFDMLTDEIKKQREKLLPPFEQILSERFKYHLSKPDIFKIPHVKLHDESSKDIMKLVDENIQHLNPHSNISNTVNIQLPPGCHAEVDNGARRDLVKLRIRRNQNG